MVGRRYHTSHRRKRRHVQAWADGSANQPAMSLSTASEQWDKPQIFPRMKTCDTHSPPRVVTMQIAFYGAWSLGASGQKPTDYRLRRTHRGCHLHADLSSHEKTN
jgi:hypothetical protein